MFSLKKREINRYIYRIGMVSREAGLYKWALKSLLLAGLPDLVKSRIEAVLEEGASYREQYEETFKEKKPWDESLGGL